MGDKTALDKVISDYIVGVVHDYYLTKLRDCLHLSSRGLIVDVETTTEHGESRNYFVIRVMDQDGATVWHKRTSDYQKLIADETAAMVALLLGSSTMRGLS